MNNINPKQEQKHNDQNSHIMLNQNQIYKYAIFKKDVIINQIPYNHLLLYQKKYLLISSHVNHQLFFLQQKIMFFQRVLELKYKSIEIIRYFVNQSLLNAICEIKMSNLMFLNLSNVKITSVQMLQKGQFMNLQVLRLEQNPLHNISSLRKINAKINMITFINRKKNCFNNKIIGIQSLSELNSQLNSIYVNCQTIADNQAYFFKMKVSQNIKSKNEMYQKGLSLMIKLKMRQKTKIQFLKLFNP